MLNLVCKFIAAFPKQKQEKTKSSVGDVQLSYHVRSKKRFARRLELF